MNLNDIQKMIAGGGAVVFVLACVVVPWNHALRAGGHTRVESAGYSLIFAPPAPPHPYGVELDVTRLGITLLVVVVVAAVAVVLTKSQVGGSDGK